MDQINQPTTTPQTQTTLPATQIVEDVAKHYDFDKEAEDQKKKDLEVFKSYGLMTKSEVEAHVKEAIDSLQKENAELRKEFLAFKEWALRKKVQGLNSGSTENDKPDPMQKYKPNW